MINKKPSKYGNKITEVDGIKFHSKKEALRYGELLWLLKGEKIKSLGLQPAFKLEVNGQLVCKYIGDFIYERNNGEWVIEDVKGYRTEIYKLKKKLFLAIYGTKYIFLET